MDIGRGRPKGIIKRNTEYETSIDRLISQATKLADSEIKRENYDPLEFGEDYIKIWGDDWSKFFHDEIDRLAALAGLRGTRKYKKAA